MIPAGQRRGNPASRIFLRGNSLKLPVFLRTRGPGLVGSTDESFDAPVYLYFGVPIAPANYDSTAVPHFRREPEGKVARRAPILLRLPERACLPVTIRRYEPRRRYRREPAS